MLINDRFAVKQALSNNSRKEFLDLLEREINILYQGKKRVLFLN